MKEVTIFLAGLLVGTMLVIRLTEHPIDKLSCYEDNLKAMDINGNVTCYHFEPAPTAIVTSEA